MAESGELTGSFKTYTFIGAGDERYVGMLHAGSMIGGGKSRGEMTRGCARVSSRAMDSEN